MVFGSAIFTMFCWIPVWIELFTTLQLLCMKYCFLIPPALTPILYFIFNKQFRHVTAQYLPFLSRFSSESCDSLISVEEGSETAQLQKDEDARIMRELAERKRLERESADKLKEEAIRQLQKREQARLLELLEIERQEKEKAMQKEIVMQKEKATQEEKEKELEEKAKVMNVQLWQDSTELQKVAHDSLQKSDNDPEKKSVRGRNEPDKQGHYEIPGNVEKEPKPTEKKGVCDLGTSEPCISGEEARVLKKKGDDYESLNREDPKYVDTKRKPDKIDKNLAREEACAGPKDDDYYFFDWVAAPKLNAVPELQAIPLEPDEDKIPRTATRTMQVRDANNVGMAFSLTRARTQIYNHTEQKEYTNILPIHTHPTCTRICQMCYTSSQS